jgi:hypothetical protein
MHPDIAEKFCDYQILPCHLSNYPISRRRPARSRDVKVKYKFGGAWQL